MYTTGEATGQQSLETCTHEPFFFCMQQVRQRDSKVSKPAPTNPFMVNMKAEMTPDDAGVCLVWFKTKVLD